MSHFKCEVVGRLPTGGERETSNKCILFPFFFPCEFISSYKYAKTWSERNVIFLITLHQALSPSKLCRCYDKPKDVLDKVVFFRAPHLLNAMFYFHFVFLLFPRDLKNNTHLVKLKSGGSNGRLPHPKKKKQRKSGVSPEEAFDRKYFSKSKPKPSHGVSVRLPWINCMPIQFFFTLQIVWFDYIGASQVFPLI